MLINTYNLVDSFDYMYTMRKYKFHTLYLYNRCEIVKPKFFQNVMCSVYTVRVLKENLIVQLLNKVMTMNVNIQSSL